jgi:hypothetical protein
VLFSVELINIRKSSSEDDDDEKFDEPNFEKVLQQVSEHVNMGTALKRNENVNAAIRK